MRFVALSLGLVLGSRSPALVHGGVSDTALSVRGVAAAASSSSLPSAQPSTAAFVVRGAAFFSRVGGKKRPRSTASAAAARSSACPSLMMGLAFKKRKLGNAPGNLFVDQSCIDCGACRWIAPETFERKGLGSVVHMQPEDEEAKLPAYQAMLSCPQGAIRTLRGDPFVKEAQASFPRVLNASLPNLYHLGYHTKNSGGANAYLVVRPGKGNVMIDTPRFTEDLARRVEEKGGLKWIIFTHGDNTQDNAKWVTRFKDAQRVIMSTDVRRDTLDAEVQLQETGPWILKADGPVANAALERKEQLYSMMAKRSEADARRIKELRALKRIQEKKDGPADMFIMASPGHTPGSLVVLYYPSGSEVKYVIGEGKGWDSPAPPENRVMFSGDTIAWSDKLNLPDAQGSQNTGGKERQANSLKKLRQCNVGWLMPGSGQPIQFANEKERGKFFDIAAKLLLSDSKPNPPQPKPLEKGKEETSPGESQQEAEVH